MAKENENEKKEFAGQEFESFCEANEIDYDTSSMNEEEQKSFAEIKKRFVKACIDGRAEVDGTSVKYTVSKFSPDGFAGETLTIKRPGGAAFAAMDSHKGDKPMSRIIAFVSAMTGKEQKYFTKLDVSDCNFLTGVATLFLPL